MLGVDQIGARVGGLGGGLTAGATSALGLLTSVSGRRDVALAVVNGLFGDALEDQGSPLATPMTIRAGSTVLPLEPDELPEVLSTAVDRVSPRICLLVHGLMSTESIWGFPDDTSTTYGTLLGDDHDLTVLSLRSSCGPWLT